tara:strand:- start:63 stop:383 length:321 start_codon:yes stop_codon:yes gene_type:complete
MMSPKRKRELCMNDEMDPLVVVGLVIAVLAAIVIISKLPEKKSSQIRIEKKKKEQLEKKLKKEERITINEPGSSDIGARLKKLRQMYKDGILSKVEFEKAKNKLLK